MYEVRKAKENGVIYISFDRWICPNGSFDPVYAFIETTADLCEGKIRIIDCFYEYEIKTDNFCVLFCWNGSYTVTAYIKSENEEETVFDTLKKTCNRINSEMQI